MQNRFSRAMGRNLIFGIRPEHIYDRELKSPFPGGENLQAIIEVVEPIGSEAILLVKCGSDRMTGRVDPATQIKPRMVADFIMDMNRMHLFDADTNQAY